MRKKVVKVHCSCTNFLYHYDFIGLERKWEPKGGILKRWPFGVQGKNTLSKSLQLHIKSCHLSTLLSIFFSRCFFCISLIDCFSPGSFADCRYVVLVCSLWILFPLAIWKRLPLAESSTEQQKHRHMWVNGRTGFECCCVFWEMVILPLKDWALKSEPGNPLKLDLAFSGNCKTSKFSKPPANGLLSEDQ